MKKHNITTKIFIGLILGIIVGLFFTSAPNIPKVYIKPFGDLFLNLIKMIIVPLVLSSLVVGSASIGDIGKLGRIGAKTFAYYLTTTAMAVTLGLILGNIIDPGFGLTLPQGAKVNVSQAPSVIDTLLNIVPVNPVKAMADANMLQIIFFALFVGIAITFAKDKGKPVYDFFDSLAEISYKIVGMIMAYAPIGVFALIVPVVAANGPLVIVLTATLASIGTAGVPGAGLIMLTMVLQSVGLPLEGIALIAGIDRILDMGRTCLNVTGDLVGATVVASSERELNREVWKTNTVKAEV